MRLAMLLDADSCIELLKLNVCFHAASGIDTVILCSGVDDALTSDTLKLMRPTAERVLELTEALGACKVKLDFPGQRTCAEAVSALHSWLAQYCRHNDVADWAIAGSVGDYWLATGNLTHVLENYSTVSRDIRGLRVARSVMVRDHEGCRFSAIHQMNSDTEHLLKGTASPAADLFADQYVVKAMLVGECSEAAKELDSDNTDWPRADDLEILTYGLQLRQTQSFSLPSTVLPQMTDAIINPCMKIYFDQNRFSESKKRQSAA